MKKILCTLAVLSGLQLAYADGKNHHDGDKHVGHIGPHVHGEAQLNVVLEGKGLTLLLDSPAMNIIGFEHQPNTDAQFDQSHEALHTLEDLDELMVAVNGKCLLASSHLDWKYKELVHERYHGDEKPGDHAHGDHAHDDHAHGDHTHDDHTHGEHAHGEHAHGEHAHGEHAHGEHAHGEHAHGEHAHGEHTHGDHTHGDHTHGEHSDIAAKFTFKCESPEKIKTLKVGLFEAFPRLEKLNVQWIAGDKQGSQILTRDSNELRFD